MNNVTFPLKPQMKGPDVADLQEALRLLLERSALLRDDESARREVAAALQREVETQTFGDATRKLVGLFQKARHIEGSGTVNSGTADALNALLREWGLLDRKSGLATQLVSGRVHREDGAAMRGVRVRALHGTDGHVVRLGSDTTDGEGRYTIRYDVLPELRRIDLQVSVVSEDDKLLASSEFVRGAGHLEFLDVKVPIVAPSSSQRLEGRLVFEHGAPAEKVVLRLYRRDFGGAATKLAETTTVVGGRYAFAYDSGGKALSLEVRAVDGAGKEIPISKPVNDLPGETRAALNLAAPGALQPLSAEYERLSDDLKPLLGDLKQLAKAKENAKQQDLTILNRATGWDARLLACAATAQRLSSDKDVKLPEEALYGLLRAGLPSEKLILASVDPDVAERALKKVRDVGIIALDDAAIGLFKQQFTTFANKARLAVRAPGARSTYGEMLGVSGVSAEAQSKFAAIYLNDRGRGPELWENARKAGLRSEDVRKLQLQGKLAFLTGSSKLLTARLQQSLGNDDPAQLTEKDLDRPDAWIAEIHAAAGIPSARRNALTEADKEKLEALIPPAFAADTIEVGQTLWAEDMARKVRRSYPTHVVARTIERDGGDPLKLGMARASTAKLLKGAAAQGFRLGQTPTKAFLKTFSGARLGLSDSEFAVAEKQLATLQRVYQITPGNEAMPVLMSLGTTSAYEVMAYSEPVFIELYTERYLQIYGRTPEASEPRLVYRKATQVSSVTYNLFAIAKKFESELPVFGLAAPVETRESARNELIKHFPTMESLFGSMDYCECEHCRSVLSPAAYLVDLLQFLDAEPEVWGNFLGRYSSSHGGANYNAKYNKPYNALVDRRPDLPHIPLTCENTNTALPYIDLVNEILEYYVAHEKLEAAAAHDTGAATTAELLTEPQNIVREAYDKVREARYPLALPFDLWIETVRGFCDYFESPLSRVLEALRAGDELLVPTQAFDRAAVFLESLRLSPVEIDLLTNPDPLANWQELYGFSTVAEATTPAVEANTGQRSDLNSAKALSRRLGVHFKELVEIVATGFVNPKLAQLVVLDKLDLSIKDVRFRAQNQAFYNQNKDLIDQERDTLPAADQARFDALSQDDWQLLKEVHAFEGRLNEFGTVFGLTLAQINTTLGAIPFDDILVLADEDAGCNFDLTIVRYASARAADDIAFLRINFFVRLWRKLGWTIEETDRALCAFLPANAPFEKTTLDQRPLLTALIYLSHLKELDEKVRVGKQSRNKLLALWADLATTGKNSLYAQLFLSRTALKTDDVFDDPLGVYLSPPGIAAAAQRRWYDVQLENVALADKVDAAPFAGQPRIKLTYSDLDEVQQLSVQGVLTDAEKAALMALSPAVKLPELLDAAQARGKEFSLLKGHLLSLQGAFGLTADDVRRILEDAGKSLDTAELSLGHVSLLYRYGLLAKGLKLSLVELIALKQLSGLDPFKGPHPDPLTKLEDDYPFCQTLRFVELAENVKASPFKLADLEYLLRHRFDETGKYRPDRDGTLNLLKLLSEGIRTIRSDNAIPADPSGMGEETFRQKLGLVLPPEVVERFLSMMNGTAEFTATRSGVAPADQLNPRGFADEPGFREVLYNTARQEQKLTIRGVLFTPEKAALLASLPRSVPPGPHVPSAVLSDLLDDVQGQASAFFEKYLKKQAPNVQPVTGFLDAADFRLLFAPPANGLSEAQLQDRLRQQRTRLATAFLPFLQDRLIREFVVQTMVAYTAADPVLVQSLLSDVRLAGLEQPAGGGAVSLLTALSQAGERGVTASFFASEDGSGAALATVAFAETDTGLEGANGILLRPTAARSARFEGYMEVPAAGAYRFFVELDRQNAEAEVHFDHLPSGVFWSGVAPADKAVLGDKPGEYLELKPGVLYRFSVQIRHLNGGEARVLVQGETTPRDRLGQFPLYPLSSLNRAERATVLLTKSLTLAQGFGLNERELRYLLTHAADFDNLDLRKLPAESADDSPAGATALFSQFSRLMSYAQVKRAIADGTDDLIGIFEANEAADIDEVYAVVAKLTRRDSATVESAARALATVPSFRSEIPLLRLWEALQVIELFGVPVGAVVGWTRIVGVGQTSEQRFAIARDLKEAIKARFEPETWQRVAQPIFDELRKRQRDALSSHVMHKHGFARLEQLYEYFLIDPGMEPVVQTSRIRLAIGSVQLFIQRCLLNLEVSVPPSALINAEQWIWMKRYRVWEANRKIFLFPENWLEPEFREDKTHLFTELEGALFQGDVSNDLVEDAFLNYLRKLDELARLDIVAMHLEDKADPAQNTLHVFGRTHCKPHKHFYRRYAHQTWTPWEPVTTEIEGDHLAPVIWRDRLYLFWVTFIEKAKTRESALPFALPTTIPAIEREMEAQLHWSEYLDKEWKTHESSGMSPHPARLLKAIAVNPLQIFISVSKEYEAGEERGVFVHLSAPFNQAFYLAGRNSIPEKGAYGGAPRNPYSASAVNATQYSGSGPLKVTFSGRITTSQSGHVPSSETQNIFAAGGSYTILPCDNEVILGPPDPESIVAGNLAAVLAAIAASRAEIASLMKPIFYQDNKNTFYIEPNVTERTIEEWQDWVTRTPQPDMGWADPDWFRDIPLMPEIPRRLPIPDPGDPPWLDPMSLYELDFGRDWLTNAQTGLLFDGGLIGAGGRVPLEMIPSGEVGAAVAKGGTIVNMHPGSGMIGREAVLVGATISEKANLTATAGGLNIIGSAGLNSSLAQNVRALGHAGLGAAAAKLGAGTVGP